MKIEKQEKKEISQRESDHRLDMGSLNMSLTENVNVHKLMGPVIDVPVGFGKQVLVLAGEAEWQLRQFKHPECCRVSVFTAHQTADEETPSKKQCVLEDEVFISTRQSHGEVSSDQISSLALKLGYFLRFIVQHEAETRERANGSRITTQVSLLYLSRPVQLHAGDARSREKGE